MTVQFLKLTQDIASCVETAAFQKLIRKDKDGCWYWTGRCGVQGYGLFRINKRKYRAHRLSLANRKLPQIRGSLACHTCDHPSCVNPDHLYWGDYKSNIRDAIARGRHCPYHKIDQQQADEIRSLKAAGESPVLLSLKFGISIDNIRLIVRNEKWASASSPTTRKPRLSRLTELPCKYLGGHCGKKADAELNSVIHRGWVPICNACKAKYLKSRRGTISNLRGLQHH